MSLTARIPEEALPFLAALANSPDPLFVTARPRSPQIVIHESPAARARKLASHEAEAVAMFASGRRTPEIASRLPVSTLRTTATT